MASLLLMRISRLGTTVLLFPLSIGLRVVLEQKPSICCRLSDAIAGAPNTKSQEKW